MSPVFIMSSLAIVPLLPLPVSDQIQFLSLPVPVMNILFDMSVVGTRMFLRAMEPARLCWLR